MNAVVKMETAQEVLASFADDLKQRHTKALNDAMAQYAKAIDESSKRIDVLVSEVEQLRRDLAQTKREPGPQGERGERGLPGRDGVDGERGPPGKDGRDGADGIAGKDGAPGRDGLKGECGERGEKGEKGDPGRDGVAGKDGAPGERGERGADGIAGERGPRGEKGDRGERGERGEKGDRGESGRDGKDGRDGRDGADGQDGRDAAQLEVLDEIAEGRSYARGTWAKREGGLWRFSGTEWQCVINGVKGIDVEQVGERTFRVCTEYSSGAKSYRDFNVNAMIYREVWEAKSYQIGDCVTWDGGMWIAMSEAAASDKPGESTAWKLAVRRGRNGKSV